MRDGQSESSSWGLYAVTVQALSIRSDSCLTLSDVEVGAYKDASRYLFCFTHNFELVVLLSLTDIRSMRQAFALFL